jgi:multiple sugar transport system substrate-binding protein
MKRSSLRRWGFLAAIAVTASAALVGCSTSGSVSAAASSPGSVHLTSAKTSAKKTVVNYWLWLDDPTDNTWQKLAAEFNAQSKTTEVKLEILPLATYEDKLLTALSSGNGPDAARFKDEWVGQFVQAKGLAPLSSYIKSWKGSSDVIPSLYKSGEVPGSSQVYMLPHQNTALYMYYNKTEFAAAGLSAPKTHADVLADAKKLTGNGHYGIDVRGGAAGQDQWAAWMYSGGAQFVNSKGKVVINNAKAVSVNQQYLDLAKYAPPGSTTASFAQVEANFLSGETAMMIHHVGSLADVRAKFGNSVGVIPIPQANPQKPVTLQTMSGNVIFQSSKEKKAAWQWISWLDGHNAMTQLSTSPAGQLPVTKSVAAESFYESDPGYQVALKAQATAKSWPQLPGTSTVVNVTWAPTIKSAFAGQLTSKQMLDTIATALQK